MEIANLPIRPFIETLPQAFPSRKVLVSNPPIFVAPFSLPQEEVAERLESLLRRGTNHQRPSHRRTIETSKSSASPFSTDLEHQILSPEPEIQERLSEVNAKRAQKGKSPIDFTKTTHDIESIMNDLSLSDKEKKDKISQMRKQLGLSKKDMKKLFTKRLGKIYQRAADQIKDQLGQLKASVKEAEKTFGKNTPEAAEARERLQTAQNQLQPKLDRYQHQASLYKNMFPGFWSKIVGFFKKIGSGLAKIGKAFTRIMNWVTPFLRLIPGIGQMISFGWAALQGLYQICRGNLGGLLNTLLNFARQIPCFGALISTFGCSASKIFPALHGFYDLARGSVGIFPWAGSLLEKIPRVGPFLSKTSDYLSFLISPLRARSKTWEEGVPPSPLN
jgi:hypothetical protein